MAEFPLVPGSTIGILGGGQLGRMLAQAAARLGFDVVIQDPEENSPAGRVAARQIVAAYDDRWALKRLAEACDVVTYEFENVPADTVAELAALGAIVSPGAKALAAAQDRVVEKSFLAEIGVPTVAFAPVQDSESLAAAVAAGMNFRRASAEKEFLRKGFENAEPNIRAVIRGSIKT